jgi:hypothetical protein
MHLKKISGGAIVLKTKIGAVLLIILATLGFSETDRQLNMQRKKNIHAEKHTDHQVAILTQTI